MKGLLIAVVLGGLLAWSRQAGPGSAVLGGALVLGLVGAFLFGGRTSGRASTGRSVQVRGHAHGAGARQEVATHEAGHVAAGRALGGRIRSATVSSDGRSGLVHVTLPTEDPGAAIAFWRAGALAAGTSRGASADDDLIRRELRGVPARDRRRVRRDAERAARRIVSRHASAIRRDAARLDERGRL